MEEQRSFIRFLWSEGVKPSEMYRRMNVQYGDSCLVRGEFMNGWKDVKTDDNMSVMNTGVGDQLVWQVRQWNSRSSFFLEGIRKLVDRWTKCIAKQGDYAEK